MRTVHRIVGIAMLLAFIATGQYMDRWHAHLRGMSDAQRLLFRSDHIYLMLAATLNLVLGLYFTPSDEPRRRVAQLIASSAIVATPFLFLAAFCTEPWMTGLARPFTRPAVYLAFGGGLLHLISVSRPR